MTRARRIVVLLLAVACVAAGLLVWQLARTAPDPFVRPELAEDGSYRAGSVEGRDREAVQAAVDAVPLALSYDFADLDRTLTAATSRMTEAFAEEFRTTFATSVRPLAVQKRAVSQARVRAAGVVSADGDSVVVLAYVDQVLVSSREMVQDTGPVKVGQTRVHVRMVRVGDSWKVDDLQPV